MIRSAAPSVAIWAADAVPALRLCVLPGGRFGCGQGVLSSLVNVRGIPQRASFSGLSHVRRSGLVYLVFVSDYNRRRYI